MSIKLKLLFFETGRLTVPKTPEYLRICLHCTLDTVEDEMKCTFYFFYLRFL